MTPADEALIATTLRQRELAEDLVVELLDAHGGDALSALCEAARKIVAAQHLEEVLADQQAHLLVEQLPRMLTESQLYGGRIARLRQARGAADAAHKEDRQIRDEVFEWFDANYEPGMTLEDLTDACMTARLAALARTTMRKYATKWKARQGRSKK